MLPCNGDLYFYIHGYIYKLIKNRDISLKVVDALTKAEIPLQTFITAAKLYSKISNRAESELKNYNNQARKSLKNKFTFHRTNYVGIASKNLIKNPYGAFLACCIISSKYYKDIAFTNESWGTITTLNNFEINELERETLCILDYKINTAGDNYVKLEVDQYLKNYGFENVYQEEKKKYHVSSIMKKIFCLG